MNGRWTQVMAKAHTTLQDKWDKKKEVRHCNYVCIKCINPTMKCGTAMKKSDLLL